jgi:hypothetical protein
MSDPIIGEGIPEYIDRILSETNNQFSPKEIVENYEKFNKETLWPL